MRKEENVNKMSNSFISTEVGSATRQSLDGESLTAKYEKGTSNYADGLRGAPWSMEDSLQFKCDEVGICMDSLLSHVEKGKSDQEIAEEMFVPQKTIEGLRNHFMEKGLASIQGQD
ncbi:response regulator receiver protein [Desulfonispora thiosulfatigenes DSM 11270]|uniref:Response regulator receiver protein n=1 Tax=Desulfonispora thiosulfatigenes DSM 11270 TaxID=656914 RepID=A0A1W1V059_DESTI|nr:hypothetical protein [Desulfonispora thiosulfatigenes]SMB86737.1 response regulator receiver protein [Desulfonispora thiosulfatigenes DSM 11270]